MGLVSEIKKIKGVSLGLVVLLIQMFMFVNLKAFFPEYMLGNMEKILITYFILYAVMYAIPDIRSRLFDEPASKIKYYVMYFLISIVLFSLVANFFIGSRYFPQGNVLTAISTVAISMILVQAVVIAFIEEHFFRDYLDTKIGGFWSNIAFGIFHFSVYQFNLLAVLWASILGYFFLWIKNRFSPRTNLSNIAVHTAYNVVILGLVNNLLGGFAQ